MDKALPLEEVVKGKYWYKIYVGECPVCGRDASYRERVYGEPPSNKEDRYIHLPGTQTYCGCEEH